MSILTKDLFFFAETFGFEATALVNLYNNLKKERKRRCSKDSLELHRLPI